MNEKPINLRLVKPSDHIFLFNLLKERDPKANISHKKLPSYSEHVHFVLSKPYSKWYVIEYGRKKAGSIYLSKNDEIGIFVKKAFQGKGIGKNAVQELMKKNPRKRFLANVSPKNKSSIAFFKNNSFKLIQYTFELES